MVDSENSKNQQTGVLNSKNQGTEEESTQNQGSGNENCKNHQMGEENPKNHQSRFDNLKNQPTGGGGGENETDTGHHPAPNINVSTPSSLFFGQRFLSIKAYGIALINYLNCHKYTARCKESLWKRVNANWDRTNIRWVCRRGGKPPNSVKKDGPNSRPKRTSMKCECPFFVVGQEPTLCDNSGVDKNGEIVNSGQV